ncbi:MAG: PD40 domain-containing protein [Bacteroidia bacterium]|nr:PD40 domain-containing protein [Bacteroidia bacterium]
MKKLICTFLFLQLTPNFFSQSEDGVFKKAQETLHAREKKLLAHTQIQFNSAFFHEAIVYCDSINEKDQPFLDYIKGMLYAHDDLTKKKALTFINRSEKLNEQIDNFYFTKAFAYSRIDSFETAVTNYQLALTRELNKKHPNEKHINEIHQRIEQCRNIISMRNIKNEVTVKSVGTPINSEFSEYGPIITSNEDMMVFTYRGPKSQGGKQKLESGLLHKKKLELYFEDIFISKKINDTSWSEPAAEKNLDTQTHDAAVSLNSDGTEMFVYKNTGKGNGDLYLSKLKGERWSKPVYQMHLNSSEWDGSACFIPNTDKIIISSERKGGYGGKDLYYAEKLKDNVWGHIKNLGPTINSKYDEDSPFVTADGNILFYSTNNESSIGGYDIERSDLVNGFWSKPYNLGPPINTRFDEEYFTVRADGKVAYFSSNRNNSDEFQDIYSVKPGIPGKPTPLLQIEGLITLDGKPAKGNVELRSVVKNPTLDFIVNSNEVSGKFLCNLPAKDDFELTVHIDKFPPQVIFLSTNKVDSFATLNVFAEFYSPGVGVKDGDNTSSVSDSSNKALNAREISLVEKFKHVSTENVKYKIQIGAYRFPKNINYSNLIGLPKIVMDKDSLDISHYTIGSCNTYDEARKLLEKIKTVVNDAFIVVYDRNRRIPLVRHLQNLDK